MFGIDLMIIWGHRNTLNELSGEEQLLTSVVFNLDGHPEYADFLWASKCEEDQEDESQPVKAAEASTFRYLHSASALKAH